jgi:hypothetical protein
MPCRAASQQAVIITALLWIECAAGRCRPSTQLSGHQQQPEVLSAAGLGEQTAHFHQLRMPAPLG